MSGSNCCHSISLRQGAATQNDLGKAPLIAKPESVPQRRQRPVPEDPAAPERTTTKSRRGKPHYVLPPTTKNDSPASLPWPRTISTSRFVEL